MVVLEVILEFPSLAVKEVDRGLPLAHQPCLQGQSLEALEVTLLTSVMINFQQKYESFSGKNAFIKHQHFFEPHQAHHQDHQGLTLRLEQE